jgi:hypothetical protein
MALRDYHQGRIDAYKQHRHERRGHDKSILERITGHKCHYKAPRDRDSRVNYRQGWRDQRNRRY